jgi:hypothetical protein
VSLVIFINSYKSNFGLVRYFANEMSKENVATKQQLNYTKDLRSCIKKIPSPSKNVKNHSPQVPQ